MKTNTHNEIHSTETHSRYANTHDVMHKTLLSHDSHLPIPLEPLPTLHHPILLNTALRTHFVLWACFTTMITLNSVTTVKHAPGSQNLLIRTLAKGHPQRHLILPYTNPLVHHALPLNKGQLLNKTEVIKCLLKGHYRRPQGAPYSEVSTVNTCAYIEG